MQTFLPYSDFKKSAECLDKKRCWKQVVEAKQLLEVLKLSRGGHTLSSAQKRIRNHPACRMWVGYEKALSRYYNDFLEVSIDKWKIKTEKCQKIIFLDKHYIIPDWNLYEPLHANHRGRLLAKNYDFYSQYGWSEKPVEENYYPVDKNGVMDVEIIKWLEEQYAKRN